MLTVRLDDGVEVVNVHSPISTRADLVKVLTHAVLGGEYEHACPRTVCPVTRP